MKRYLKALAIGVLSVWALVVTLPVAAHAQAFSPCYSGQGTVVNVSAIAATSLIATSSPSGRIGVCFLVLNGVGSTGAPIIITSSTSGANTAQTLLTAQPPGGVPGGLRVQINEISVFASAAGAATVSLTDGAFPMSFGTVQLTTAPTIIPVNTTFSAGAAVSVTIGAAGVGVTTTVVVSGVAVPSAGAVTTLTITEGTDPACGTNSRTLGTLTFPAAGGSPLSLGGSGTAIFSTQVKGDSLCLTPSGGTVSGLLVVVGL